MRLDCTGAKGQAKALGFDREGNTDGGGFRMEEEDKNTVFETEVCLERVG